MLQAVRIIMSPIAGGAIPEADVQASIAIVHVIAPFAHGLLLKKYVNIMAGDCLLIMNWLHLILMDCSYVVIKEVNMVSLLVIIFNHARVHLMAIAIRIMFGAASSIITIFIQGTGKVLNIITGLLLRGLSAVFGIYNLCVLVFFLRGSDSSFFMQH